MMSQATNVQAQNNSGLFLFKNFGNILIDWIFPPACANCGRVDEYFCEQCRQELLDLPLEAHRSEKAPLAGILSSAAHKGIAQEAVQALKYQQGLALAPLLAERLARCLMAVNWTFDTIIPVPLSNARLAERGYNQAKEISHNLAEQLNIPHSPEAIQKIRHTRSQVGLNQEERLLNLKDAFYADASLIRGKDLLLVDDVKTTGTTLAECAQVAINAGAKSVYAITVTTAI